MDRQALVEVVAAWAVARPPFPGLREALLDAEGFMNRRAAAPEASWERLRKAKGDEDAAADAVNGLLSEAFRGLRLGRHGDGWRVFLAGPAQADPKELAAVQALVLLVEHGGWSRVRRCGRAGCERVVLDITSGGNRRACPSHVRAGGAARPDVPAGEGAGRDRDKGAT